MDNYLNDPREMTVDVISGVTYEQDNRIEEMYHWNAKVTDLCDMSIDEYMKHPTIKKKEKEPNYLRFMALENNSSVSLNEIGTLPTLNLEYRINKGDWTSYTYGTAISLDNGDYMDMRNADDTVRTQVSKNSSNYRKFVMSGKIKASGNIMFLLDKEGESLSCGACCFMYLFKDCSSLESTPNLPATTLDSLAYAGMFYGCSNITSLVEIKAEELGSSVFNNMLRACSKITEVHVVTINTSSNVFNSCNSLSIFVISAITPPTIGASTITGIKSDCIIYVPDASVEAYKAAQYWSARADYIKGISERPNKKYHF